MSFENIICTTIWLGLNMLTKPNLPYLLALPCLMAVNFLALTALFNTLRPRQNGPHFTDDTFKRISLNENIKISIKISLNFVPWGPINNIPALVQIMAWRQSGAKPLSEPQWWLDYRRIYVPFGLNEIMAVMCNIAIHILSCLNFYMYAFIIYAYIIMSQIVSPHTVMSLRWRHNERDGVSNHQPHDCLLNRLSRRRSKETSKLCVTGLLRGIHRWPVNSPHKGPVTRKMFPFDDVIVSYLQLCCSFYYGL